MDDVFSDLEAPFIAIEKGHEVYGFTSHFALCTVSNKMLEKRSMVGAEVIDATGASIRIVDMVLVGRAEPSLLRFLVSCFFGEPEFVVAYSFVVQANVGLAGLQERVCAAYAAQKLPRFDRSAADSLAEHQAAIRATRSIPELHRVLFPGVYVPLEADPETTERGA